MSNLDNVKVKLEEQPSLSAEQFEIYQAREKHFEKELYKQMVLQGLLNREKLMEKQTLLKALHQNQAERVPEKPLSFSLNFDHFLVPDSKPKLVPIRLDIDQEGVRIRDVFTWNLEDKSISLEEYAKMLLRDTGNQVNQFQLVARAIKEQIDDYFQHSPDLFYKDLELPERRVLIQLDITIGQQSVYDKFEWDLGCTRNSPELFAEQMVLDLQLPPEFITAIAHSIREQLYCVSKSLLINSHDFYAENPGDDIFLPTVNSTNYIRAVKDAQEFGPNLTFTSIQEMEKLERDLERESRRRRRQTQRSKRLVPLPERESNRTHRTSLPTPIKFVPTVKTKTFNCLHCQKKMHEEKTYCETCEIHKFQFGELPDL